MSKTFRAAPKQDKYRPAFTVEKLDGTYTKLIYEKTDTGLVSKEVTRERGYLVTFLKGHSIHVETMEELKRLELSNVVPIHDTSSDEEDEVGVRPLVITPSKSTTSANRSQ